MPRKHPRELLELIKEIRPKDEEPLEIILGGRVLVDGRVVSNPRSLVRPGSSISFLPDDPLRGELKLGPALDSLRVNVEGKIALDLGAAAGGFTKVLLERGSKKVYAVDVGHGQLLGSLRQDARVVNLENTNLSHLDRRLIPDEIDVLTIDLSYLSLASSIDQLGSIRFGQGAEAIALVKPMFELGLPTAPSDRESLDQALKLATEGFERHSWRVDTWIESPITGGKGAPERFLHARFGG